MEIKFFKLAILVFFIITPSILAQNETNRDEKESDSPEDQLRYFEQWQQPYGLNVPETKREEIYRELNNMPSEPPPGDNPVNSWEFLGPNGMEYPVHPDHYYSGRVLDIETDNPNTGLLVASASGGLWAYANTIPYCMTDDVGSLAIGSFDSQKNNWNTIIIGTGEPSINAGDGIYKTTNKGVTWVRKASSSAGAVYKLRYHSRVSTYPNTVFAATTYGVLRSDDNGETWTFKLTGNCTDLCFVENFSNTYIYTSKWGDGIYYSTNNGDNWSRLTSPGLPQTNIGRVAIASRFDITSFESYIYVSISKNDSDRTLGVYKSINTGQTFTNITPPGGDFHWGQGWYNNCVSISPTDLNLVNVGGCLMRRSSDGGNSWQLAFGIPPDSDDYLHPDYHVLTWSSNGLAYAGTDGGISTSYDGGLTWSTPYNQLPITQFYSFDLDPTGNYIYGGAQDNGIGGTLNGGSVWHFYLTGDGAGVCINQFNPSNIFVTSGESNTSILFRRYSTSNGGSNWLDINSGISPPAQLWAPKIRTHGTQPLILYTEDGAYVYQSNDFGLDWFKLNQTAFPANLFNLDVSFQPPPNGLIFACLQPSSPMSGKMLRIYDNGTWYERSSDFPTSNWIRSVTQHQALINYAYACINGYGSGSKIYKTTNRGVNWINISGNLPDVPMSYCVPHPTLNNVLFAGSQFGCFKTSNGGMNWIRWNNGMPNACIVTDMKYVFINGTGYVYASTYGRGIWRRAITGDDPSGYSVEWHKNALAKNFTGSQSTYDTINAQVSGNVPYITRMVVQLDTIFDNNDAQLQGFLIAPNGQTDTLFFNPGPVGGQDFFITQLHDTGPMSIQNGTAPFTGIFRPRTALSKFEGMNPNGNWIFKIYDGGATNVGTLQAWSLEITYDDTTVVGLHGNGEIAKEYRLYQNYPNPFNPSTNIKFSLAKNEVVKITVYDMTGREMKILVNRQFNSGVHSVNFDASNYSSGVYFYKLESAEFNDVKKMVVLK